MMFSVRHDQYYYKMILEMLAYAGFPDSINKYLKSLDLNGSLSATDARQVDDLYSIYGEDEVLD